MGSRRSLLLICSSLILAKLCTCEFVPVYIWGTQRLSEPISALHKISQSSFKDEIINKLKTSPTIVVFAELSLSPEDFGQRDGSGNIVFPNLSKIQKTSKVTYLPNVQNPIKATKHAFEDVVEIPIERLKENFEIPKSKVVIVDLNDASENEQRSDMLKRHDELIAAIYDNLLKNHDSVLALYTAHHASWIESGEVHSRKTRALSDDETKITELPIIDNSIFFYISGNASVSTSYGVNSIPLRSYSATKTTDNIALNLTGNGTNGDSLEVRFTFVKSASGYWFLQSTNIVFNNTSFDEPSGSTVYAPAGFSYACGDQVFKNKNMTVTFKEFQVQPMYGNTSRTQKSQFDDPYNCVGFTTIPIWSGLFVTFILLLIMTIGLTMMMDIKTMDRFDDAKGKTITINVSE